MTEFGQGSVHALSGAYVVDALDDAERAAFEEHLPGCADCTAEVASLREAASLLAEDAALTPPESLRAGVLAGIRSIRPLPPEVLPPETLPPETGEPETATAETGARVVTLRPRRTRLLGLMVAAAVVAILAVAAVAQPWRSGNGHGTNSADRVVAASDAIRTEVRLPGGASATVVRSPSLGKAAL
ncbi:MAG: zf-HC2 domain-containing protein, partial [Marmoricola sp.]|nr:zf-HC2 domain-containing protein [Marmoricola sp.]